jgi:hypothetical protein
MYYRVYDLQVYRYFYTGYNAQSKKQLIEAFQSYICMADNVPKSSVNSWNKIEEWLQGVQLEKSKIKFEEYD